MTEEAEKGSPTSGFAQMSFEALKSICAAGGGHKDLAAYIVLASGVSGRHNRYCTHGATSIEQRTGISRRAAEGALKWLDENGFIRRPSEGEPKYLGNGAKSRSLQVRWVLNDAEDLDLQVCRQFIDGIKSHPGPAPLAKMLADIDGDGRDITRPQAISDAILLYAALMREQDFDDCAGVDPSAWWQRFEPDHDEGHITPVPGVDAVMVTVKESSQSQTTWNFIEKVLGQLPDDQEGRDQVASRFWRAARALSAQRLTYRVLVLWQGDPLDPKTRRQAAPVATQYINDSWARKIDPHLQYDTNRAAWRVGTRDAYSDFSDARSTGSLPFTNSGSYRYMVRSGAEKNCYLVGQLRVRYWPKTKAVVQGRQVEQRRTEQYSAAINAIGSPF